MTAADAAAYPDIAVPAGLQTPCTLVDIDRLERNVARMADELRSRDVSLRPHAKTHNSTRVAALQREAGACGLTVGTLRMAEGFAAAGFDDLFIAAPVWAADALAPRLRALHDAVSLRIGIDSAEAAAALGAAVAGARTPLEVSIELDSGEGRSGVTPEETVAVARAAQAAGLRVVGVFTHGGHSYAKPGAADAAAQDEVDVLGGAAAQLADAGFEIATLSAGSTPTVLRSARPPVTEERPGTYVFNDRQQVGLGGAEPDQIALVVAATVISVAVPGQVILDCGAKALAKDRPEWLAGHGELPAYPGALVERVFDFHAVVRLPEDAPRPRLGDVVTVVPNHVCPVVNLSRELVVVRGGDVLERWAIDARG